MKNSQLRIHNSQLSIHNETNEIIYIDNDEKDIDFLLSCHDADKPIGSRRSYDGMEFVEHLWREHQ